MKLNVKSERTKRANEGEITTPQCVIDLMLKNIKWDTKVIEPSAGTGNIYLNALLHKLNQCDDSKKFVFAIDSTIANEIHAPNCEYMRQKAQEIIENIAKEKGFTLELGYWFAHINITCGDALKFTPKTRFTKL